jgi:hypothetical protein
MLIRMSPTSNGEHQIVIDPVVLKTPEAVDEQIRYLETLKDMLWPPERPDDD